MGIDLREIRTCHLLAVSWTVSLSPLTLRFLWSSCCQITPVKMLSKVLEWVSDSPSLMSNYLRPHGLQPARLLCQWNSPGKNTGVGCHFLLQGSCLMHINCPLNVCCHWFYFLGCPQARVPSLLLLTRLHVENPKEIPYFSIMLKM